METLSEVTPPKHVLGNEQIKNSKNSQTVYLKLLGLEDYPKTPDDLPDDVVLPHDLNMQFNKGIHATLEDQRERSQMIRWNKEEKNYRYSRMYKGTSNEAGYVGAINRLVKTSRFVKERALVDFHTHPDDVDPFFSAHDVAYLNVSQAPAYMTLVVARDTAYALLLTEKFKRNSKPVEHVLKELEEKGYDESHVLKNASLLEARGLGVYEWREETDDGKNVKDIRLKRV
jgi:hypothetical protein